MCEADLDIHTYNTQIPTQSVTAYAMQICCNTEYNNALFTIPHIREKKRENFMQRGKDVSKLVEHNCNTNIYNKANEFAGIDEKKLIKKQNYKFQQYLVLPHNNKSS